MLDDLPIFLKYETRDNNKEKASVSIIIIKKLYFSDT